MAKPAAAKSTAVAKARPADAAKPVATAGRKSAASAPPAPPPAPAARKPNPRGITVVTPKPTRPAKPKPKFQMPVSEPLFKPGGPKWKPLIPSGPSAPPIHRLGQAGDNKDRKGRLGKRELERYRSMLLRKRAELIGDIATIEDEALRQSGSGSLSHLPQHMAEQGTDVFDQSLSLDLAQVDRNLIREIDAALARIDAGTYGICELTGKPIKAERLEELPWARYSIEAARERERRPYQQL